MKLSRCFGLQLLVSEISGMGVKRGSSRSHFLVISLALRSISLRCKRALCRELGNRQDWADLAACCPFSAAFAIAGSAARTTFGISGARDLGQAKGSRASCRACWAIFDDSTANLQKAGPWGHSPHWTQSPLHTLERRAREKQLLRGMLRVAGLWRL